MQNSALNSNIRDLNKAVEKQTETLQSIKNILEDIRNNIVRQDDKEEDNNGRNQY